MRRTRIISGIVAFVMATTPFAGVKSGKTATTTPTEGVKQITVSADSNFKTVEAARDFIRTLDKSKYEGIEVTIASGTYLLDEAIEFTAEDSGTETCPITYKGEEGTHFYGGVTFAADAFEPLGDGEVVQYFPEDVKDKLVQIDLKKLGFTEEDAVKLQHAPAKGATEPTFLFCNGEKQTVARFPNETDNVIDGYAKVAAGSTLEPEWTGDVNSGSTEADYYVIYFSEDYNERVHDWHDITDGYVEGRFRFMWCSDGSQVVSLDPEEPMMKLNFVGGYTPREGMVFFWYHIPEELDIPGEYYVDDDCILYYYPTEEHESATYSMPTLNDNMITIDGAEYLTFENLTLDSSRQSGISGEGNHLMIDSCTITGTLGNGIRLNGVEITVQNCSVTYVGKSGIHITGGDIKTLTRANNLIYNNYVAHWSVVSGIYEMAISSRESCGTTISHNEICHSVDWGIEIAGAYNTVEYNHCYDLGLFQGDQAVIRSCTIFGGTIRYNYVHDCGFYDDYIDFMGISGFEIGYVFGQSETYGNIVCNVSGNGILIGNTTNADVHDNIFISCRKGAIKYTDAEYVDMATDTTGRVFTHEDSTFLHTPVWLEHFPWLSDVLLSGTSADSDNPNFWRVPSGSVIKNNFIYTDKSNLTRPDKLNSPYEIWDICKKYSEIVYPTDDEVIVFSSKRSGMPDIKEAIVKASGTVSLTVEEFEKIGRVAE